MTDAAHRHKWVAVEDGYVTVYFCEGCDDYLPSSEIERRLNAVECLSAEDARGAFSENGWVKVEAYAKALEETS